MYHCYTSCIYYYINIDKSRKPSVRLTCDYREGEEIKNIPIEEIKNCEHFKTYKEIQESNKKFYKFNT